MPGSPLPLHIEWIEQKCSNCLSCVVVCAERHTGMSAPSRARIRIFVDLLTDNKVSAEYCRQCVEGDLAPCAEACPEEAIAYSEAVRAWLVDEEKCMACAACVDACPYGAIQVDTVTDKATKCDLCGGLTRCIQVCAPKALYLAGSEVAA